MLAVHGFFYAVDCARVLLAGTAAGDALQAAWPSPTLAQVEAAAGELCSMDWGEVREAQRQRKHRYTAGLRQLEGRCHMLNAVLVLLRDALLLLPSAAAGEDGGGLSCASGMGSAGGAAAAPGGAPAVSLAITFAEELGGESVDWPLGAYLSLVVAREQQAAAGTPASAAAASAASAASPAAVARSRGASGGGGGDSGGGSGGMMDVEGAELFALLTLVAFAAMLFAVQRLSGQSTKRPRSPPVRAYYELQTEYLR